MDPRLIPKGQSSEDQFGGKRTNEPGVYFHPEAGKYIETPGLKRPDGTIAYDVDAGRVQGDAFAQIGYRPATDQELKEYRAKQEEQAKAARIEETRTTTAMSSSK